MEDVFSIEDVTSGLMPGKALRLRGRLLVPARQAYERLAPTVARAGYTLMMRREEGRDVLVILNWLPSATPDRPALALVLGLLTVLSMLVTYSLNYTVSAFTWQAFLGGLGEGLQFTLALVTILVSHEMGHYIVARRFGLAVSLPYLIPFPLTPFGTMGAIIRMKGIPASRRAMLYTGAAGPIAGLIVCLPILIVGLMLSQVQPLPQGGSYVIEGNSLLYALLKYLIHGQWLPSNSHDLFMHPLAFAGWAGLLVTGLNLIPAGQLDGGHVARAWLGQKAGYLNWVVVGTLIVLGFVWPGWIIWAALTLLLGRGLQEPLESITPLSRREAALAVALLCLFVVTITPVPLRYIP